MKYEIQQEDGMLRIVLPSRIESLNYSDVQKEIWEIADKYPKKKIVLDAGMLEYISSAGLRILLGLKKRDCLEVIDHVSNEIYGILDVSGMLGILDVKLEQKSNSGTENLIGEDSLGYLYKLDDENVVRICKDFITQEEEEKGSRKSKIAIGCDVSSAILCGKVSLNGRSGYSYAAESFETVQEYLKKHPEEEKEILQKLCTEMHRFHDCREMMGELSKAQEFYEQRLFKLLDYKEQDKEKIHSILTMLSRNRKVIFSIANPETILYANGKVIFVDLLPLLYGNPLYELAGMVIEMEDNPLISLDCLVEAYMPKADKQEKADYKEAALKLAELLKILLKPLKGKKREGQLERIKHIFIEEFDSVKELIKRIKDYQDGLESKDKSLVIDIRERTATRLFRKRTLLKNIRMEIKPGELVMLLGGSGAGKTTFFNAVTGYEKADATILLGGKDLYKEYEQVKHRVAFAPQQDLLRDEDTVYNTLSNAADMRLPVNMSREDKEKEIERMLELFGLSLQRDSLIRTLSGGQRKRASIAVEFIANPMLFFLDEPDSGLDAVMARSLMEDLRKLTGEDKMIVVISHSPDRVIDLFDKVIILAKSEKDGAGHLAFFGSPQEAREFFDTQTMEQVLRRVNLKVEGGDGRADEFVEKYACWR